MVNFAQSLSTIYEELREISQHGLELAKKLQEMAPSNTAISPSAQYLYHAALMIQESSYKIRGMMLERINRINSKES